MKNAQSGFSLLLPIAIVFVLAIVGFAGYKVTQNSDENDTSITYSEDSSDYSAPDTNETNLASADSITNNRG